MAFRLEFNKNPPRIVKRGRVTTVSSSRIGVPISPTWGYCCSPPSKGKSRSSSSSRGKKRSRSRDKERTSMFGCVWKWDTGYPKNIQTRYFQYIGKINDKPLGSRVFFLREKTCQGRGGWVFYGSFYIFLGATHYVFHHYIDGNGGVMCILMCTLLGTEAGATL